MADNLINKLRAIAQSDADPERRRKAKALLWRKNETVSGQGTRQEELRANIAKTNEQTDRLRSEQTFSRSEGWGDAGNKAADYLKAAGGAARDLATSADAWEELQPGMIAASEGVQDIPNWLTSGKYKEVRDAVLPGGEEAAQIAAQHPTARGLGQGAALTGLGSAIPAGAGVLRTGATAGAEATPLAFGRRMSEGESPGEAAINALPEAAIAAGTAGAIRTAGRALSAPAEFMRGKGPKATAARTREKNRPFIKQTTERTPGLRPEQRTATVADEQMQSLIAANKARREAASEAYERLTKEMIDNADPVVASRGIIKRLEDVRKDNLQWNNEFLDDALESRLSNIVKKLKPRDGAAPTVDNIMSLRRVAKKKAKFESANVDDNTIAWRDAYKAFDDALDSADNTGAYASARSQYRKTMDQERAINEKITGRGKEALEDIAGQSLSGASRLQRLALERGGTPARMARELEDLDPNSREALEKIRAMGAESDLAYRVGGSSYSPRAWLGSVAADNATKGVARGLSRISPERRTSMDVLGTKEAGGQMSGGVGVPSGAMSIPDQVPPPEPEPVDFSALPPAEKKKAAAQISRAREQKRAENLRRYRKRKRPRIETVDPYDLDPYTE